MLVRLSLVVFAVRVLSPSCITPLPEFESRLGTPEEERVACLGGAVKGKAARPASGEAICEARRLSR